MRTTLALLFWCIGLTVGHHQVMDQFVQKEESLLRPATDYRPMMPMNGLCLDEEEEQMRFANESCSTDADCFNSAFNTTSCKNGFCTCGEDFVIEEVETAAGSRRSVCVSAPDANMTCTSKCVKPYVCADPPSSPSPNANPKADPFAAVDAGTAAAPVIGIAVGEISPMSQKTCQCLAPYVERDFVCVKDCNQGEIYFYYDGKCLKRCAGDEIQADDGTCKKVANLGDACEGKDQCTTPFADCIQGKCACATGFTQNSNTCESKSWSCPAGQTAPLKDGKVVPCSVIRATKDSLSGTTSKTMDSSITGIYLMSGLRDTCDNDQYCAITSGFNYVEGSTGFCCPMPKLGCPAGDPHPTATCDSFVLQTTQGQNMRMCPSDSHTCRQMSFGEGFSFSQCCPNQCSPKMVFVKDRCYPQREFGDQCEQDQQCKGFNGACQNGVCGCASPTVSKTVGAYTYCAIVCQPNEREIGIGQCVPVKQLGDKCDPNGSNLDGQCPMNSHCSIKSSVCICDCGMVRLNNQACGSPLKCAMPSSKNSTSISPTSATFCRVPGLTGVEPRVQTAANECPSGQYCQTYMEDLGLCCPMPAQPQCPDGDLSTEKCDPMTWNACGDSGYCHQYLNPAGIVKDSAFGYTCCPFSSLGGGSISTIDAIAPIETGDVAAYGDRNADLGSADMGSVDLGSVDMGNVDMGSGDFGAAGSDDLHPAPTPDEIQIAVATSD